ncbi:UNVERIFIED_CONTAM: hypothetical protein FKN15_057995 [Acipenser sinensis]
MLTTNRSLAEESLSLRPRLDNGKLQLAGKYQELELLSASCQEKQERIAKAHLELSPWASTSRITTSRTVTK